MQIAPVCFFFFKKGLVPVVTLFSYSYQICDVAVFEGTSVRLTQSQPISHEPLEQLGSFFASMWKEGKIIQKTCFLRLPQVTLPLVRLLLLIYM